MSLTAINFDGNTIRVLPQQMHGSHCCECDKPRAKWELLRAAPGEGFICSLCMLYKTRWGEENEKQILEFVDAVVEYTGKPIKMNEGRVVKLDDADRIFGAIVAENKVTSLRQKLWRVRNA